MVDSDSREGENLAERPWAWSSPLTTSTFGDVRYGMPRGDLPVGTITLLFTDIEGSTQLWEKAPEAMRVALARHDRILRNHIEDANGFVFKTIGDAFCASFETAVDAVQAAVSAQIALRSEPWPAETPLRVRMVLHTGAVECRDADYFGPPLNRAARLLSACHGEQVLVSSATREQLRDHVPLSSNLKCLGDHRLKDIERPETVFQVCQEGLRADFPPLRTIDPTPHRTNLPQPATDFIGREKQIAEAGELLKRTQLLTLTGAGGCGKTRLGLEIAAVHIGEYSDGVWLVELGALSDPDLAGRTVASVLGIRETRGEGTLSMLAAHLRTKELLLILDNCEHLLDACAVLTGALIAQCSKVRILATSREALGIPGEVSYRVPSLALPRSPAEATAASLSDVESVRLFVDRASLAEPTFGLTDQNAPPIASICQRLDGLPLALELAAGRVRSLPVEQINARLEHCFRLLTGGSRTALPRQQTLRSVIDWSYNLLAEKERALLGRLSVFSGGWTVEGAESVCSDQEQTADSIDEFEVVELLVSLVEKSLVVFDEARGRYRMLETVRQYARDRLLESGSAEAWRDRHLAYFLELGEIAEPHLVGAKQQIWLQRLEEEHDNFRAALEWSLGANVDSGIRIAAAIWRLWDLHGHVGEGRRWIAELLAAKSGEESRAARARMLLGGGQMARNQGDYDTARRLLDECLSIYRSRDDREGVAGALNNLGNLEFDLGNLAMAKAHHEESLAIRRQQHDKSGIAASSGNLGNVARQQGDAAEAKRLYGESLTLSRELGDSNRIAMALNHLGVVALDEGNFAEALPLFVEALLLKHQVGERAGLAAALERIAAIPIAGSDPERAARLLGAASRLRGEVGVPLPPDERPEYEKVVAGIRTAMADDEMFEAEWAAGCAMTTDEVVALAVGDHHSESQ